MGWIYNYFYQIDKIESLRLMQLMTVLVELPEVSNCNGIVCETDGIWTVDLW